MWPTKRLNESRQVLTHCLVHDAYTLPAGGLPVLGEGWYKGWSSVQGLLSGGPKLLTSGRCLTAQHFIPLAYIATNWGPMLSLWPHANSRVMGHGLG